MSNDDIIKHYNQLIKKYGMNPRGLGWKKERQNLRFAIFCEIFDFNNSRILDFGCGLADFYNFLILKNYSIDYTGLDINPSLIKEAKKRYPKIKFILQDFKNISFNKKFDFIVSSGVHNTKIKSNLNYLKATFKFFYDNSVKGFAINMLSNKVQYFSKRNFYWDPNEVLNIAYKYSNRLLLRNDYMPFEFTLFVWHDKSFLNNDKTVFLDYMKYLD